MTRQILVGGIPIGGGAPVVIQSMLNTKTTDVEGSLSQIRALAAAGCQIARLAVPNMEAARTFADICKESPLPLVADIHFDYKLALAAAEGIAGIPGTAVFSVGSDGTDGPTDAAGGYCDWQTAEALKAQGVEIFRVLRDNDAYHALEQADGLVFTGPTGTNVNDVAVALLRNDS